MKILIKNKKWNITFGNRVLVCDIKERDGIFHIKFAIEDKVITIKSKNIDITLRNLEEIFLREQEQKREYLEES